MNNKVAVIGGGSFGTALATLAARDGREVIMYVREEEIIEAINNAHVNPVFLPDLLLPKNVSAKPMDDISNAIILLVRVGAVARFVYCLVRLTAAEEQAAQYKKRARNTVIFYIIAESIWQINDLILYYYS